MEGEYCIYCCSLIKSPNSKNWFKFNDTDVTLFNINNLAEEDLEQ